MIAQPSEIFKNRYIFDSLLGLNLENAKGTASSIGQKLKTEGTIIFIISNDIHYTQEEQVTIYIKVWTSSPCCKSDAVKKLLLAYSSDKAVRYFTQ